MRPMKWILVILLLLRLGLPAFPGPTLPACADQFRELATACPCCDPDTCPCVSPDDARDQSAPPALPASSPRSDLLAISRLSDPNPTPMSIGWDDALAGLTLDPDASTRLHPALNARVQAALCIWRT